MRYLLILFGFIVLISCSDDTVTGNDGDSPGATVAITISRKNIGSVRGLPENSVNLTPTEYRMALVNLWMIKDDSTEISVLNPDPTSPIYTEVNPLIVDLSSDSAVSQLFNDSLFSVGTYTKCRLQFIYLEMGLPVAFHSPEHVLDTAIADTNVWDITFNKKFRLYFNANGPYWKRDFIVELDSASDEWFWMRRSLEGSKNNFFINAATTAHPPGGAGPDNTLDLFCDEAFWGADSALNDTTTPLMVTSNDTVGGLSFTMSPIVIPADIDSSLTIDIGIDIRQTLNYWELDLDSMATDSLLKDSIPIYVTLTDSILDLGPGTSSGGEDRLYGDKGIHPFLPKFEVTME